MVIMKLIPFYGEFLYFVVYKFYDMIASFILTLGKFLWSCPLQMMRECINMMGLLLFIFELVQINISIKLNVSAQTNHLKLSHVGAS